MLSFDVPAGAQNVSLAFDLEADDRAVLFLNDQHPSTGRQGSPRASYSGRASMPSP
jgi:hypothetical protein